MHPLDRKLWRDLWRLRAQVLAIALVIGSGVGVMVMALTAQEALKTTADAYYERYRFADVFAGLTRAPERLARRIAEIEGVQTVETRIADSVILDMPDFIEPVMAQVVSLPEESQPLLNRLFLREGRLIGRNAPDEVIVNQPFAEAHGLSLGSRFGALIDGRRRTLEVVGIGLSPEFCYAIGPGALMPDNRRFGVIWMGREALAAALDRKDAFNSVTLSLLPGADAQAVVDRLDALLKPYGGGDAIARADQISNWFLMNEIDQLGVMAAILPTVFLVVAAFLSNMVIGRLIATERSYIGLFKAFGYTNAAVAWHYGKLVLAMASVGVALGWAVGAALGAWNTAIYAENFSLPFLIYRPSPASFAIGAASSLGAALLGGAMAVRAAVRLAPAEAMRPPSPTVFSRNRLSRTRVAAMLDQPTRMILRHTLRWPLRSAATSLGVAMSIAVLVSNLQWLDSIEEMISSFFIASQRQDATVYLTTPRSSEALQSFAHMPGVQAVEGARGVSTVMRAGPREKRVYLTGMPDAPSLNLVYDASGGELPLKDDGLALSTKLAEMLDVGVGDRVEVEALEGRRGVETLPVTLVYDTYIGAGAYLRQAAANRFMRERESVDAAHLKVDPARMPEFFAELKRTPGISGISLRQAAIDMFDQTLAETMLVFVGFFVAFGAALAVGVTYNAARIALSERARELATLRVLGFTRLEIAYILIGQSALLVALALPLGCLAGWGLSVLMSNAFDTELFRVPLVIQPATYGWAMLMAIGSGAASAYLVRRQLDRLDLIAVLKTRE